MSKAILIIDTPKSCMDCNIFNHEELCCLGRKVNFGELSKVQSWCPLKPFNEKALKMGNKEYIIYQRDYLYKNLDREIEQLKMSKKYYEMNMIGEKE